MHAAKPHHGKHKKRKRGCHKGRRSPETLRWERDELIPEPPPWMEAPTYHALAALRGRL